MKRYAALLLCLAAVLPAAAQTPQPGPRIDYEQLQAMDELRRGVRAYHQGFFSDAIVTLKKALGIKPEEPLTRMWLGRAFFQSGYEDAAMGEWKQALALPRSRELPKPILENLLETLAARRSPAVESELEERWVQTAELAGVVDKTTVFSRPAGLRSRRDGFTFLVSYASHEVLLLDPNGVSRRRLRGGLTGFDHPFDLVEASDGSLFVSEFKGDRIAKCTPSGDKIKTIGRRGRGPGELIGPQYICLDSSDNLYVSDYGNGRIVKYDRDGKYLLSFGPSNRREALTPTGLAFHEGRIFVADAKRGGLLIFDVHGNFETAILEERLFGVEGIRVAEDGTLLVANGGAVLRVDPERETIVELHRFTAKARVLFADIDANGNLLAADFDGGKVHVLGSYQDLYRGLQVYINRISADNHPEILVEASVLDRYGRPVVSLDRGNFIATEDHRPVGDFSLQSAAFSAPVVDVALLVECSPETREFKATLERAVRLVFESLGQSARIRIVAAYQAPALVVKPGVGPVSAARELLRRENLFSRDWSFDTGVRLAVSELLNQRNRRAVVFIGSGRLPEHAFRNLGFQEVLGYLRVNSTAFYTINLGRSGGERELELLSRESGGKVYFFQAPASITALPADMRRQKSGTYYFRYQSGQDTGFGRRYVPVELEAVLAKRSGRDELGYFGPLR